MTLRISVIFFCLLLDFFQKFGYLLLNTVFSPPCPGGGMADAADLKSASHKEYGFDPRPGYQLSFYEKRKLDKEKRRIAFLKKAWQKLRRYFFTGGVFFLSGCWGLRPLPRFILGILCLLISRRNCSGTISQKLKNFFAMLYYFFVEMNAF